MPLQFEEQEESKRRQDTSTKEGVSPKAEAPAPATDHKRIKRLLRFMSPYNRVKQMAQPLLQKDPASLTPPSSIEPIKKSLLRNFKANWREKEVALWYLAHAKLTEPQKQEASEAISYCLHPSALRLMSRVSGNIVRLEAFFVTLSLMLLFHSAYLVNPSNPVQKIVVWVKVIFSSYFQNKSVWDPPQMGTGTFILFNIPFLLLPPLTVVAIGWYGIRLHKLMGEASDTLGALEQVSAIPTLALFIHTNLLEQVRAIPTIAPFTHRGATNQTNRAKANLFKLYVLLTPEHLGTLPNRTTLFLCPLLNKKDLSLVKETLHALEVIGDARAIPTLKRLSETHTDTDIRETAQRLMYLLEEREALLNHKTHLLRASHAPKEADNSLLRPAYHTPEEAPEELLRPFE